MPVERRYPLNSVVEVLRRFPKRVTFEYVMIEGVNDRDDDARALGALAAPLGAFVNLLPLHPGGAPHLTPTPAERMDTFGQLVREAGVAVTVRRSRGLDIAAACGQLRTESGIHDVAPEKHADVE
jgi:23S rRNA (adenine2503-C2)-methyltransferase